MNRLARVLSPNRNPNGRRPRLLPAKCRARLAELVARWFYAGSAVVCPICDARFREFLPDWNRANAICPRCQGEERHRLLWHYFQHEGKAVLSRARSVLHVGPEPCISERLRVLPGIRYLAADLHDSGGMVRCDLQRLPFTDGSFDVLLCGHVLEHVEDDLAALGEMRRVLAAGGWAIVLVPVDELLSKTHEVPSTTMGERFREFRQFDHVRCYGADFSGRLAAAGFTVVVDRYVHTLDPARVGRYAMRSPGMYVCRT